MPVDASNVFAHRVDSALSYLGILSNKECDKTNKNHGINVVKIVAAATESRQENDTGKGMKCTRVLQRFSNLIKFHVQRMQYTSPHLEINLMR